MAEGAGRLARDTTSELLAMIHNVNCSKRSAFMDPHQFHPYKRRLRVKFPFKALKGLIGKGMRSQSIKASDVKVAPAPEIKRKPNG